MTLLLALGGCALFARPPAQPPLRPLAPLVAGDSRQLLQHITVTYGGEQKDLLGASLLGEALVKVSLLTPQGVSLLDIHYDGREVTAQQYLGGGRQIPPRALLADMQLVYWPLALLRASLPEPWKLREDSTAEGRKRALFYAGELHTEVSYDDADIWRAQVQLEQKSLGYTLRIENL